VLALLLLGIHDGARVWKGFDWDSLNRLHEKGFISDPRGKAKSVVLTEDGLRRAENLIEELFSHSDFTRADRVSEHVYAVVRFDRDMGSPENSFIVKEIVGTQPIAEAEVERLNKLNADKNCTYFWQVTRQFSAGKSAGNRNGERALHHDAAGKRRIWVSLGEGNATPFAADPENR
jgi:hypothetical protein